MFRRYGAFTSKARQEMLAMQANVSPGQQREPVAIYDDASETIFLPEGWTGSSPVEVSVLVHEMVHHMQKRAGLRYGCPAAREEIAYRAQDQWLGIFGKNLFDEFNLDAFTLKITTVCGF